MLNIAGYCRISVDTEKESDENTSIENQERIIKAYAAEHFPDAELTLFADRDRSGYTFEQREKYQALRPKLLNGFYKILIVKDFSRFSRRNSYGLVELETLRDAGVRIIAISDGIDYPVHDDWMLIQFKFLMNEMPVTDTSKKVRTIIANRQKSGKWICAVPYGYRIINTKEMSYDIDPPAAETVREIFDLYNSGWGYKKIADHLTDSGIPTPRANEIASKEASGQHTRQKAGEEWSIITVSHILRNDFYIGVLRQHKFQRSKINGADQKIEKEDQIVIENAHTPIIDIKTFLYTQDQLNRRSRSHYRGQRKYECPYSGMIFCGDCGAPMFSVSRPDLAPAYTCGTYHKRGRKACTRHHIRTDTLDSLLKRYIQVVMQNSASIIKQLEEGIKEQPERENQIGTTLDSLQRQLDEAKDRYKALIKRRVIDTMGKSEKQIEIIESTYTELEEELTNRIAGLETQINQYVDKRNDIIKINRAARTVMDVFQSILKKDRLSRMDISLIVDKIIVYEDRIDIQLKADIDGLLKTGTLEEPVNFNGDSKDIKPPLRIVQSAKNRQDRVFAVNVLNEGDALEIFTDREGGVILKKYSPIGELGDFAREYAESLHQSVGHIAAICDKDSIIAVSGIGRREKASGMQLSADKPIHKDIESVMANRAKINRSSAGGDTMLGITTSDDYSSAGYTAQLIVPIIAAGDAIGAVMLLSRDEGANFGQTEIKVAETAAGFMGRQIEN